MKEINNENMSINPLRKSKGDIKINKVILTEDEISQTFMLIRENKSCLRAIFSKNYNNLWEKLASRKLCDTNVIKRGKGEGGGKFYNRRLLTNAANIRKLANVILKYKDSDKDKYNAIISLLPISFKEFDRFYLDIIRREKEINILADKISRSQYWLLVVAIAMQHVALSDVKLSDLLQVGDAGLMVAAKEFPFCLSSFSVYAAWWIEENIIRAVYEESRTINIPGHNKEFISKIIEVDNKIRQGQKREPTIEDYAKAMDMPTEKIDEAKHILSRLSEAAIEVMQLYFGIDSGYPRTLKEVGKICNLSPQCVSQITRRAIIRLRHPSRARYLQDYKDELDK